MHAQEIILFVSVVALAAALVIVVVAPRVRGGVRGSAKSKPAPETSARAKPGSAKAGPAKAGAVIARIPAPVKAPGAAGVAPPAPPAAAPSLHMTCPTCRRHYAPGLRYCPYDARVLTADLRHPERRLPSKAIPLNAAKICPHCSRRYETGTLVCGRDGTALVSVN